MITVYTKSYCPFCKQAKELLDSLDVKYQEIDITDQPEKMSEISQKSGFMTVPQIFVDENTCLGGYSDIKQLHDNGELLPKLKQAE